MYSTEQIIDFFYASYSLDKNNQEYSAAARAYLDLCRTIKFNGASKETRVKLRKQCQEIIVDHFLNLDIDSISYDKWHENLCETIIEETQQLPTPTPAHRGRDHYVLYNRYS